MVPEYSQSALNANIFLRTIYCIWFLLMIHDTTIMTLFLKSIFNSFIYHLAPLQKYKHGYPIRPSSIFFKSICNQNKVFLFFWYGYASICISMMSFIFWIECNIPTWSMGCHAFNFKDKVLVIQIRHWFL